MDNRESKKGLGQSTRYPKSGESILTLTKLPVRPGQRGRRQTIHHTCSATGADPHDWSTMTAACHDFGT